MVKIGTDCEKFPPDGLQVVTTLHTLGCIKCPGLIASQAAFYNEVVIAIQFSC